MIAMKNKTKKQDKLNPKTNNKFNVIIFTLIILSVFTAIIETVKPISSAYNNEIYYAEILFSLFFTVEYIIRIKASPNKKQYIFSFLGIIDFLSILPFYIGLLQIDATSITLIRTIRLMRIFRIFKLANFLPQEIYLLSALKTNLNKIIVFLLFISIATILFGSAMYFIEGDESGFTSIPKSIYWAIVTMTTVGYGDLAPKTIFGQILSSIIMLLGYATITVPTGLVINDIRERKKTCTNCEYNKNLTEHYYCGKCGKKINK